MPTPTLPSHHDPRGGFRNPWPTDARHGLREVLRWAATYERRPDSTRYGSQPLATPDVARPRADRDRLSATWVGHSTFLLQIAGANVVTDPMWGHRASPVSWAGPARHMPPGIPLEDLPPIDVVVVSHNHYDHLDAGTVRRLARAHPEALWCVPLGLGSWVRRHGPRSVVERDWWGECSHGPLTITCVPAQHFSGRGPRRNRTLWGGWVVAGGGRRCYFAGDTGYYPDVGTIARRIGALDLLLLPVGAYEPPWFMRPVHLSPEEAVQAYLEIAGRQAASRLVAMHWGTFKLTVEPLGEPPQRLRAAWGAAGLPPDHLCILQHGETRWFDR